MFQKGHTIGKGIPKGDNMTPEKRRAPKNKKPDLTSRAGKYFLNRQKGLNKRQAQLQAGCKDGQHSYAIENSKTYKTIEKYFYKDALLSKITLHELADEHLKNIMQDEDRGAKNKAIEMALSRLEPDKVMQDRDDEVTIVLRSSNVKEAEVEEPDEVVLK